MTNGKVTRRVNGAKIEELHISCGFVHCDPPVREERNKRARRKDYYYTPSFQGW